MAPPKDKKTAPEQSEKEEAGKKRPGETPEEKPEEKKERLEKEKEAKKKSWQEREKMRRRIETLELKDEHHYELGVYEGAEVKEKFDTVEGSVDATPYPARLYKEKFYQDKAAAAKLLLKLYEKDQERFTESSQDLIKKHKDFLESLAKQNEFEPSKFKASFETGHSGEEIFGTDGIYNFVLTFQRVMDAFKHDEKALTESRARIHLRVGETMKSKDERYVRTFEAGGGGGGEPEPEPTPQPEPEPKKVPEKEEEEYPEKPGAKSAYLAAERGPGGLAPGSEQFTEQVKEQSTELLDVYTSMGMVALIEGLKKVPDEQKQEVLKSIFQRLGETDPAKTFELMKEIIKHEKGEQEAAVLEGLKTNIEKAPTENKKNYWRVQLLLFENSQTDALNNPKLTYSKSHENMRQIFALLEQVDVDALPEELREMAREQKTYLELTMRQSLAADLVESATMSLEAMMKNKKKEDTWFENSLEEMRQEYKAKGQQEFADSLKNWYDSDAEVYMSAAHVFEALRLLITYQYPKDAQDESKRKEIQNPVEYYYKKLMDGSITEIELPEEGITINDPLNENPVTAKGTFNVQSLFVDREAEKDLFEQYQNGEERLGEDSIYNVIHDTRERMLGFLPKGWIRKAVGYGATLLAGPAALGFVTPQALGDAFSDDRRAFLETNETGFIQTSNGMFPPMGKLSEFMKGGGELGSAERAQIEKIKQLFVTKQYNEARALCIQILQDRLAEKQKIEEGKIAEDNPVYKEIKKDYSEKITAQVRLQLKEKGITKENFKDQKIPRPTGGFYEDMDVYLDDKLKMVLQDQVYIKMQGELAEGFTDSEAAGFSRYEKEALDLLNDLNGKGWFDLKEEYADIAKLVTMTLVEIVIIELVTWGAGTEVAAATTAARVAQIGARVGAYSARLGRAAELTLTGVGVVARSGHWAARATRTTLRATAFVEAQSAMHGRLVNPASHNGAVQIATMAATLGSLGYMQRFMQGTTRGALLAREAAVEGGKFVPKGFSRLNPMLRLESTASYRLGQLNQWLVSKGAAGAATAEGIGIMGEVGALHYVNEAEKDVAVLYGDLLEKISGKRYGVLSEDEKAALKDPNIYAELAHNAAIVLGLRTWGGLRHRLDMRSQPLDLPRMRDYLGRAEQLSPTENAYLAGQLRSLTSRMKGVKSPEQAGQMVRELFDIPEGTLITRKNFNELIGQKFLAKLDVKVPELEASLKRVNEELTKINGEIRDIGQKLKGMENLKKATPEQRDLFQKQQELIRQRTELNKQRRSIQAERQAAKPRIADIATLMEAMKAAMFPTPKTKAEQAREEKEAREAKKKSIIGKIEGLKTQVRGAVERYRRGLHYREARGVEKTAQKAEQKAEEALKAVKAAAEGRDVKTAEARAKEARKAADEARLAADAARVHADMALARGVAAHKGISFTEAFKPKLSEAKEALKAEQAGELQGARMKEAADAHRAARKAAQSAERTAQEAQRTVESMPQFNFKAVEDVQREVGNAREALESTREAREKDDIAGARFFARGAEVKAERAGEIAMKAKREAEGAKPAAEIAKVAKEAIKQAEKAEKLATEARKIATQMSLSENYGKRSVKTAGEVESHVKKIAEKQLWTPEQAHQVREAILVTLEFQAPLKGKKLQEAINGVTKKFTEGEWKFET